MMTNYFPKLMCCSFTCRTDQQNFQQYNFNKTIQRKNMHPSQTQKSSKIKVFVLSFLFFFFHFFFSFSNHIFWFFFSLFFSFQICSSVTGSVCIFFQSLICLKKFFFTFRSIAHYVFYTFALLLHPYSLLLSLYLLLK